MCSLNISVHLIQMWHFISFDVPPDLITASRNLKRSRNNIIREISPFLVGQKLLTEEDNELCALKEICLWWEKSRSNYNIRYPSPHSTRRLCIWRDLAKLLINEMTQQKRCQVQRLQGSWTHHLASTLLVGLNHTRWHFKIVLPAPLSSQRGSRTTHTHTDIPVHRGNTIK